MYAVIRKFNQMRDVREAGRRAEAGLAPLLRQMPGFRGYYVIAGDTGGASITFYENQEAAQQAHQRAMGWIRENLADLTEAEPEVTAGEVLVSVETRPELAL